MWIVSIEKLGEKIYGCIDDGVNYHIFSIDPDSSMDYEKSYYKGNYNDYDHFVFSYAETDPVTTFLEEPVEINADVEGIGDGNRKNVLILTQPKGYRKKRSKINGFARMRYPRFPGLCEALANRYIRYNETMDFIDTLEQQNEIFIIRPRSALPAGRIERNKDNLYAAYDQGYRDASESHEGLCRYLANPTAC